MANHIAKNIDNILQHPYAGVVILCDFNTLNDQLIRDYPLKQIVKAFTRGQATLDKIYTNIHNWYFEPVTIPYIASSDHCAIVLYPLNKKPSAGDESNTVLRRTNSANGRHLLPLSLLNFNWQILYQTDDVDSKANYFTH